MQAAGVADETIRHETGWFVGMDGKWRWEIDDSSMRYDASGDLRGAESARWAREDFESARDDLWGHADMGTLETVREYNRADMAGDQARKQELYDELIHGPFAYYFGQYAEALDAARKVQGPIKGGMLQDYIDHPALFEAYPQLRSVGLRFDDLGANKGGYYDPNNGEIVLDRKMMQEPEDVLVHEIQHTIQDVEGFASGSNVSYREQRQDGPDAIRMYDDQIAELEQKVDGILAQLPEDVAEEFRRWSGMEESAQEAMMLMQELADGPYKALFNDYFLHTWTLDQLRESNHKRSPKDLYRNTSGEIEARDSATRQTMTPEQRKNTPPDLGDENTVFVDSTHISAQAIGRTVDNKPFVTVSTDVLSGVPKKKWVQTVKNNLKQKYPKGVVVGRNNIRIDTQSRKELTYSKYMQWLKAVDA